MEILYVMKIKKLLLVLFCVVLACSVLVGCEDDIGEYFEVYEEGGLIRPAGDGMYEIIVEEKPEIVLDFYVIAERPEDYADADVKAQYDLDIITVKNNINLHLKDEYRTELNIHYLTAEEYDDAVKTAKSGIVLINSESLMNHFVDNGSLVDLSGYLASEEYEFGTLNVQITSTLLEAAATDTAEGKKLFCIPNNHIVGSCDYIAINSAIASKLQYGKNDILAIDSVDEANAFLAAAESSWSYLGIDAEFSPDSVVRIYDDVVYGFKGEGADGAEWVYNISGYPTVTKAEAYSAAYGVLAGTEMPERAMEIIYALNTDVKFRNLLQYGVLNNDYSILDNELEGIDSDAVYVSAKSTLYKMNILYTGDIFVAYYNTEYWNEEMATSGKVQNSISVLPD